MVKIHKGLRSPPMCLQGLGYGLGALVFAVERRVLVRRRVVGERQARARPAVRLQSRPRLCGASGAAAAGPR